jgi:CRP-like cAMP-binding protein
MLTIEKVIILKSVEIFSGLLDADLGELAAIAEEVEVKAGAQVLARGDIGRSLYVIVQGKVRVHDEGREIAVLGDRDVVGELAALDPEPRAASVTAVEDTVLFRLDHEPLYELMADHIEVVRDIIRVLCKRLRSSVAKA